MNTTRLVANKLKSVADRIAPDPFAKLNRDKLQLIDFVCQKRCMRSFADLGGVWNVDGGYTFYALEHHQINSAALVDTNFTPAVLDKQRDHPELMLIEGNFGATETLNRIGKVDGVFFFDTLLHQVSPDWNEVLSMYAPVANTFLILNQQYTNFDRTTRLLDLGPKEYFKNVPHAPEEEPYKTYFRNLDAIDPGHNRPYRDIHNIWQWAIVDDDLIRHMQNLGFKMQFYKNCGQFGRLENVENHAFVFSR